MKLSTDDHQPARRVLIGTERHEARRIDRQLRGRSGRQGDPGQSVFFLSLEDDLMRSEEHTSELQSQFHLVCRLLLEKKKKSNYTTSTYAPLRIPKTAILSE